MTTQPNPFPPAPETEPVPSPAERFLRRVLPYQFRPAWTLDYFYAVDLSKHKPPEPRADITIEWIEHISDVKPHHRAFLKAKTGLLTRISWYSFLRRSQVWIAMASWQNEVRHFTFVQVTGGGALRRFAPLMRENSVFMGPIYTAPEARGQAIFPYVMESTMTRCKEAGFQYVYGCVHHKNEPSLRGMRKAKDWQTIGKLLLRRPFGARYYHIRAATIERPELTRLAP